MVRGSKFLSENYKFFLILLIAISGCYNKKVSKEDLGVEIGRYLFFDKRLSVNDSKSCASCHNPSFGFTDGYKKSFGAYADMHTHNTLPLFNLTHFDHYTYLDTSVRTLEQQMLKPFFGENPIEMGMKVSDRGKISQMFKQEPYKSLLSKFPDDNNLDNWNFVINSISSFLKTITSNSSKYDLYLKGQVSLDTYELKGLNLFFSKEVGCSGCHGGINFSSPGLIDRTGNRVTHFYHFSSLKKSLNTHHSKDEHKYRVPSLRNLAMTGPYLHDGSIDNLTDVLKNYQDSAFVAFLYTKNSIKAPPDMSFSLSDNDVYSLVKFLRTLNDDSLKSNLKYTNPFKAFE